MKPLFLLLIISFQLALVSAQSRDKVLDNLFTTPKNYVVSYSSISPLIDGDIDDVQWQSAKWTENFVDIQGDLKPKPRYNTRVKMLWTDTCLLIAAELQEPHVWAKVQKHDEVIFYDNDFEVFLDPDNNTHQYFEIEVNALNQVFDLFLSKPYRNNSGALISWDTPGMRKAVKVLGTLNNSGDTDQAWTVEMAIPFKALSIGNETQVPTEGSLWRINFSRVEWDTEIINNQYVKKKNAAGRDLPEDNWVWSPQGVINMHYPERWGYLQFTKQQNAAAFELPYSEKQRKQLWEIYYRQKEYKNQYKKYATDLADLKISPSIEIDGKLKDRKSVV